MKKLLVVLLAVVMVFGFASSAFAASQYTDIGSLSQNMQDAIAKLSALEVIEGYPDGTFGPSADITRAEFAKIACNLAGIGTAAENLSGSTSRFADVPSGSWFTGWVNLAAAQGFVNGYPDGSFRPNNNITMQEVVTVLLRICGYDDNLPGPWPFDYIAEAASLDITKGLTFVASGNANRGDVALMSSETLDQDIVYWDADKARFIDVNTTPKTLLEDSFKTGISKDATIGEWTVTNYDKMTVTLQFAAREYKFASNYYITNGLFLNNIKDHLADVYYNDDNEIIFVDVLSTATFYDKVTYDYHEASTSGSTTKAAYIDNIKIDNKKVSSPNIIDAHENAEDFQNVEAYAKFFYNDDDELYKVNILATPSTTKSNPIVVESATSTKINVFDDSASAPNVNNKQTVVIKNGEFAKVEDLEKGDIFFRKSDDNGVDEVIIVVAKKEGLLTKATSNKLTIDGTAYVYNQEASKPWTGYSSYYTDDNYDTIAVAGLEDYEDAFDTTVQFVTADGNPFYVSIVNFSAADDTTRLYGIVTGMNADVTGKISGLTVMNQNGSKVTYDIIQGDNSLRYYDNGRNTAALFVDYGSYIEAKVSNDNSIDTDDIIMINDGIYNFTGYQKATDDSKYVMTGAGTADVSNNRIKVGSSYYNVTSTTIVLNALLEDDGDFDKAELLDYSDITRAKDVEHSGIIAKLDGSNIVAMAILDSGTTSSTYGVLTNLNYSSKYYVDLVGGDTKIEVSSTNYKNYADYEDTYFVSYKITSSKLVATALAHVETFARDHKDYPRMNYLVGDTALPSGDDTVWVDPSDSAYGSRTLDGAEDNWLTVKSRSGSSVTLVKGTSERNYTITSNAKIYMIDVDDAELVEAGVGDISKGSYVYAISTDEPDEYEIDYVIIIEQ